MSNDEKVLKILKELNNIKNDFKADSKENRKLLEVIKKESAMNDEQAK